MIRGEVILVGLDGSPTSTKAFGWAVSHSVASGAEVLAVHVVTYSHELAADLPPTGMTDWRRAVAADLEGAWTAAARDAGANVRTLLVEADSTAAGLLDAAHAHGATLVVLGAHGHGNLADRLLGSTTYRVTHRARTPVVVVPLDWPATLSTPRTYPQVAERPGAQATAWGSEASDATTRADEVSASGRCPRCPRCDLGMPATSRDLTGEYRVSEASDAVDRLSVRSREVVLEPAALDEARPVGLPNRCENDKGVAQRLELSPAGEPPFRRRVSAVSVMYELAHGRHGICAIAYMVIAGSCGTRYRRPAPPAPLAVPGRRYRAGVTVA